MPASRPTLVWFRLDLRLDDNPALQAALARGGPIVPVFVWAPEEERPWYPGGASRWWLHRSLAALDEQLRELGARLVLRHGPARAALQDLIDETGAGAVFWNRRYEPAVTARDAALKMALRGRGVEVQTFNAALLFEPWTLQTSTGGPFRVFTPFYRACLAAARPPLPVDAPAALPAPPRWPRSEPLEALGLEPTIDWAAGLRATWTPGARGGAARATEFLQTGADAYASGRQSPAVSGTSRLSPHLHFGEVSVRRLWQAGREKAELRPEAAPGMEAFLRQVVWREFAHHTLFYFPDSPETPLRPEFAGFPWVNDPALLRAWQRGRTGHPLVDAGMRELWTTGAMHNRVRLVVGSFLVKDLLIPWQQGARWFWDTLVDADLANNTFGWQWTAGCGADAAPYFRIFNPARQGETLDPDGAYVRRWVPELAALPPRWIHRPCEAPADERARAGVKLGETYPAPIVDHGWARQRALAAFEALRAPRGAGYSSL